MTGVVGPQRRIHPPVQLDLVVQLPGHRCDGAMLGNGLGGNVVLDVVQPEYL